jgi:hypothetical protein
MTSMKWSGILWIPCMAVALPASANPFAYERTSCIVVKNAELVMVTSATAPFWEANSGHEVQFSDARSVLLIRVYRDLGTGSDAGYFSKLSFEFMGPSLSYLELSKEKAVRSQFSKGNSGFVYKKSFSTAESPAVNINFAIEGEKASIQRFDHQGAKRLRRFRVEPSIQGELCTGDEVD